MRRRSQDDDGEWRDWGDASERGRVRTVLPDVSPAPEDERRLAGVRGRAALLLPGRGEGDRVGGVLVAPDAVHDPGEAEGDGRGLVEGDVARYLIMFSMHTAWVL